MHKYYTRSTCVSSRFLPLGGNSRQIFGFKGLAGKVFQNQRLAILLRLVVKER